MKQVARIAIVPDDTVGLGERVHAAGGEVVDPRSADALVWLAPHDADGLRALMDDCAVEWVQVTSAGVEKFRAAGCLDGTRQFTSARGLYGQACAEHVLALTLSAMRRIHVHARTRDNSVSPGFSAPEQLLSEQHVVVVGTGGIGQAAARLLKAFGAAVTGVNRSGRHVEPFDRIVASNGMNDVVSQADVVVLCAPLTDATIGLFDAKMLDRMQPSAWLVNVARGQLVVTEDLVAALGERAIAGACLDVTEPELLPDRHPLWDFDNVIVTPHVAATWAMSRDLLLGRVERNVRAFISGEPLEGVVDQLHGY